MGGQSHHVFTYVEKHIILVKQNHKCAYCADVLDERLLGTMAIQFDHFYPRSKGGSSSKLNMNIAVCARCNRIKSDKVFDSMRDVRLYIRGSLGRPPYDEQTAIPEFMLEPEQPTKSLISNPLLDRLFGKYDKKLAS